MNGVRSVVVRQPPGHGVALIDALGRGAKIACSIEEWHVDIPPDRVAAVTLLARHPDETLPGLLVSVEVKP